MSRPSEKMVSGWVRVLGLSALMGVAFLTACTQTPPSDQQVREQAQQATEKAKQDSKEALQDARVAAANAEQKVNDVAAGVREGLKSNTPNRPSDPSRTDLNTASASDLAALPGISEQKARQIIRHRPYASPHALVDRGLLTENQYAAIAPDVTAH
jgi:Helix-hairpin-helix motif